MSKNLVIAGKPGVGKTSLIKEVTFPYREQLGGFYTEQILSGGSRIGFKIITFDGNEAVLASKTLASKVRVNKYGVDLAALEQVGVRSIKDALERRKVIVIDEIGSMETLSDDFREQVSACFNSPSAVLATIREGARVFEDSIKKMDDTQIITFERKNYMRIKEDVARWLKEHL